MNQTDRKLKRLAKADSKPIPDNAVNAIDTVLDALPERKKSPLPYYLPRVLKTAAVSLVLLFVLLPNLSHSLAQSMQKLPVIGKLIKVITIRDYFYEDDYHQAEVEIPSLEAGETESNTSAAIDFINASVKELTDALLNRFETDLKELGNEAHFSLKVDYDVLTNTDEWFTLKINVYEGAGSSNTYFKVYHINKTNGRIEQLSDLFKENTPYLDAISKNIRQQMKEQMHENPHLSYWLDAEYPEWNFFNIKENQNFYFAENGNIVILFDKYEVAPGAMGTPQFEIPKTVYETYLK